MKTNNILLKFILGAYLVVFFGYLLGPLVVMSITAFNSPSFPKLTPWECLTFEWFDVLAHDERILNGIENSFVIGIGTVILSVIMGLAGALLLTQIWPKLRATYYTIVIAPILIPGVVLGISTLVFWDRMSIMLGMSSGGILHNGIFLTILGQSTFIASYCMLVFIARLQRFDTGLTEAALDLGATQVQAFRKILLPFMKPAIGSAAVLAFLASFENYNTTTFTFGKYPTLTIELAQKVRYGINPSISALAFIIIALTILGALAHEIYRRRQQLALANGAPVAAVSGGFQLPKFFRGNPAAIILVLLALGGASTIWFAQSYSPNACKMDVREQKQLLQQERIKAIREKRQLEQQQKQHQGPDVFSGSKSGSPATQSPGKGAFGNVFAPGNLDKSGPAAKPDEPAKSPGKGAFGDVFSPKNLDQAAPKED
ncbi:ABC transporter permease [Sneathiella sp. HT1-7]|uniref:ABC transporter permease n=1 Tax=Sneathiella sp. HT1-7 TaxID=2887192 RepID=UPI001D14157C|nr:ABC transporter permease [Sneathiella sp. HT1-7]MCC3306444.1 ABC transporter permease [Sneathiella sp. HT1-7]